MHWNPAAVSDDEIANEFAKWEKSGKLAKMFKEESLPAISFFIENGKYVEVGKNEWKRRTGLEFPNLR